MNERLNLERNPSEETENKFGELSDPEEIRAYVKNFIEQPLPRGEYATRISPDEEKARELENKMAGINELRAYLKDPLWSKNREAWEGVLDEFERELKQQYN